MRTVIVLSIAILIYIIFKILRKKKNDKVQTELLSIESNRFTINRFWELLNHFNKNQEFDIKDREDIKSFLNIYDSLINILNNQLIYKVWETDYYDQVDFIQFKIFVILSGENFFRDVQNSPQILKGLSFDNKNLYQIALREYKNRFNTSYTANLNFPDWL